MSDLKRIREKLGLSQPDFSSYLDVSLSLLKMAETGARQLPTAALLKFSAILLYEAAGPKRVAALPTPAPEPVGEPHNKKLYRAARLCKVQAYTARQKLETVQAKHEQAVQLRAFCNYFLHPEHAATTGETEKLWLELMQRIAAKRLKQYSPDVQQFLAWKLACLEFGETKGTEMLGKVDEEK